MDAAARRRSRDRLYRVFTSRILRRDDATLELGARCGTATGATDRDDSPDDAASSPVRPAASARRSRPPLPARVQPSRVARRRPSVKDVGDRLDAAGVAVADLADPDATCSSGRALIAALGGIDVLVNNAGILRIAPLLDITVEEWDLVHATSTPARCWSPPRSRRRGDDRGRHAAGGSSTWRAWAAKRAGANQAHYAASKAAVIALTQAAAMELGPHGITVNASAPATCSPRWAPPRAPRRWSRRGREVAAGPLRRAAPTSPAMALFLASDDAAYCTGQAMNVTGGMVMH